MNNIGMEKYEKRKEIIGRRLREERKSLKLSQDELAEKLYIGSRQTVARWENGSMLPSMSDLLSMCCLFNCEMGYLLCEHDCKTRAATDIQTETGLSEKAINELLTAYTARQYYALLAINELLQDDNLYTLEVIGRYLSIGEKFTVEGMSGQHIKEKSLIALEMQQLIDSIRSKVQRRQNGGA